MSREESPSDNEETFMDTAYQSNFLCNITSRYTAAAAKFTDISLRSGDGAVMSAHRFILAANSKYFNSLFNNEDSKDITLHNITGDILRIIINYCYSGEAEMSRDNAQELMMAADYFNMISLREGCVQFITKHLNHTNCVDAACLAHTLSVTSLLQRSVDCIGYNFMSVSRDQLMSVPVIVMKILLQSFGTVVRNTVTNAVSSESERQVEMSKLLVEYLDNNQEAISSFKELLLALRLPVLMKCDIPVKLNELIKQHGDSELHQIIQDCKAINSRHNFMDQVCSINNHPEMWAISINYYSIYLDSYTFDIGVPKNQPFEKYSKTSDVAITGITLWFGSIGGNEKLCGLKVQWSHSEVDTFGSCPEAGESHEITLQPGEYIHSAVVYFTPSNHLYHILHAGISGLSFTSSSGKLYGPFGDTEAKKYSQYMRSCQPSKLRSLCGFSGSVLEYESSSFIGHLVLYYRCMERCKPHTTLDEIMQPVLRCYKQRRDKWLCDDDDGSEFDDDDSSMYVDDDDDDIGSEFSINSSDDDSDDVWAKWNAAVGIE